MPGRKKGKHGLRGLREARFRLEHPGQYQHRLAPSTRWESAVRTWMAVLSTPEVQSQQMSPWDVLLLSVRLSWMRVLEVEADLTRAKREHEHEPNHPIILRWLQESRRERTLAAKTSKAAVDCGVAERLVQATEMEAKIIVHALAAGLDTMTQQLESLGLSIEAIQQVRVAAHAQVHEALLSMENADDLREIGPPA